MHPKEALKKFLKLIGADTRSAIVSYIVVALILAMGGLSALYKRTQDVALQILTTPTPIWATILLVLLGYLYIQIKVRTQNSPDTSNVVLDEPKINILKILFAQNASTEQVAKKLGIQLQTAAYHLEELASLNMILLQRFSQQLPGGGGPFDMPSLRRYSAWTLKQVGRKYLLDNNLIEA
jgi:predicted transcriptional regulator